MELTPGVLGLEVLTVLVLKGVPLAVMLLVAGSPLRRASPRLRAAFWALGLLAVTLLPLTAIGPLRLPSVASGPLPFPGGWVESGGGTPSIGTWIFLLWAVGAAIWLGRLAASLASARTTGRAARPCDDPRLLASLRERRRRLGIRRTVRLALSPSCDVPLTYGWIRPVVLLPTASASWSRSKLDSVLSHELNHVARHHTALAVGAEVVRALNWPNPLVWHLANRMRADQELTCDAAVVRDVAEPTAYAGYLVEVARTLSGREAGRTPALPLVRGSTLRDRVRFVLDLDGPDPTNRSSPRAAVLAGILAVTLSLGVATATPWEACEDGVRAHPDAEGRFGSAVPSSIRATGFFFSQM